jgi:O-antigen/teichoic acid export membrane protein
MMVGVKQSWLRLASPASLRARFGSGFAFSLVAAVFNSGSTLLVNLVVANLLGREVFGEFAIVQNTLLTLVTVASLANGFTTTKYVAEFRSVDLARTRRVMGLSSALSLASGLVFTLGLALSAPWLAGAVLKAPVLAAGLALGAATIFFNVNNNYQTGVLAGLESYQAIAKAGIMAGTAYLVVCAAAAYLWGRDGALAGLAVSAAAQWLALRFFLRRECARHGLAPDYRGMLAEHHVFLKFALPAALSGFSTMPALWLASTVLVRQPNGFSEMALYAAANNMRVIGLFVPSVLNNVGISILNNIKGENEPGRFRKAFWGNLAACALAALGAGSLIVLLGHILLGLYGRSFGGGYSVLAILMAAMVLEALMLAAYQIIQSQGRIWLSFFAIALPRDWTIAGLAFLLAPRYGAVGLAAAYLAGIALAVLITAIASWHVARQTNLLGRSPAGANPPL